jgi:FKBP-type peptidyl-prolyl cis-trans isomerase
MIKRHIYTILMAVIVVLMISLLSCDPGRKYEKDEKKAIDDYLSKNSSLNFVLKPSGLYYLEVQEGTGRIAATHDTAFIFYTGKFLDGTTFDTNVGSTDTLKVPINEGFLITGFDEGLTYMKVGGKSTLLIPSKLGYGPSGYYTIGGYTPLLFDVELVRVTGPLK